MTRSSKTTSHVSLTPSRRTFLKTGASVAAGLSVPYFIPSSVLARQGKPGANDRVHVGMIASGARAEYLVNQNQTP